MLDGDIESFGGGSGGSELGLKVRIIWTQPKSLNNCIECYQQKEEHKVIH